MVSPASLLDVRTKTGSASLGTVKKMVGEAFAWDYSQVSAMRRAVAARALGLDPAQFSELPPGSSVTIINGVPMDQPTEKGVMPTESHNVGQNPMTSPTPPATPAPASTSSLWPKVAAGLGLLLGGAGGGAMALQALKPSPPAAAVALPQEELVEQQQQPDGTWKDVRVIGTVVGPQSKPSP